MKFTISTAASATFPNQSANTFPAEERYDYRLAKYNDVPNDTVESSCAWRRSRTSSRSIRATTSRVGKAGEQNHYSDAKGDRLLDGARSGYRGLGHRDPNVNIMYEANDANRREINTTEGTAMKNC